MINVSDRVRDLYKSDSVTKNYFIAFRDKGIMLTNSEIVSESLSITESICSSGDFKIGLCESATMKVKVSVDTNVKGDEVTIFQALGGLNPEITVDKDWGLQWNGDNIQELNKVDLTTTQSNAIFESNNTFNDSKNYIIMGKLRYIGNEIYLYIRTANNSIQMISYLPKNMFGFYNLKTWDSNTVYKKDSTVLYNDYVWKSLENNNKATPGTPGWENITKYVQIVIPLVGLQYSNYLFSLYTRDKTQKGNLTLYSVDIPIMPLGLFQINSCKRVNDYSIRELQGYDRMQDVSLSDNVSYLPVDNSVTINTILNEAASDTQIIIGANLTTQELNATLYSSSTENVSDIASPAYINTWTDMQSKTLYFYLDGNPYYTYPSVNTAWKLDSESNGKRTYHQDQYKYGYWPNSPSGYDFVSENGDTRTYRRIGSTFRRTWIYESTGSGIESGYGSMRYTNDPPSGYEFYSSGIGMEQPAIGTTGYDTWVKYDYKYINREYRYPNAPSDRTSGPTDYGSYQRSWKTVNGTLKYNFDTSKVPSGYQYDSQLSNDSRRTYTKSIDDPITKTDIWYVSVKITTLVYQIQNYMASGDYKYVIDYRSIYGYGGLITHQNLYDSVKSRVGSAYNGRLTTDNYSSIYSQLVNRCTNGAISIEPDGKFRISYISNYSYSGYSTGSYSYGSPFTRVTQAIDKEVFNEFSITYNEPTKQLQSTKRSVIASYLELNGLFINFNRLGISTLRNIQMSSLYPHETLFPRDHDIDPNQENIYPMQGANDTTPVAICKSINVDDGVNPPFDGIEIIKHSPSESETSLYPFYYNRTSKMYGTIDPDMPEIGKWKDNYYYVIKDNFFFDNFIFTQEQLITICKQIIDRIGNLQYFNMTCELRCLPYMEVGDNINILTSKYGYETVILRRTMNGCIAQMDSIETDFYD